MTWNWSNEKRWMGYFLLFTMLIICVDFYTLRTAVEDRVLVGWGTAFDLICTVPILYYFLVIRKRKKKWTGVIPVIGLGVLVGRYSLPAEQLQAMKSIFALTAVFEGVVVLFEGIMLVYGLFKLRAFVQEYRALRSTEPHWVDALRKGLIRAFGSSRIVEIYAMDFTMFSYLFRKLDPDPSGFSYHKKTSFQAMMYVFGGLTALEAGLMHLVLQEWSHVVAWVATGLSVYTLVLLIAYTRSVQDTPILVREDGLYVRIGFPSVLTLEWSNIAEVRSVSGLGGLDVKREKDAFYAVLLMEEPQFVVELHAPAVVQGPFGTKREVNRVYFCVDDPQALRREVESKREAVLFDGDRGEV